MGGLEPPIQRRAQRGLKKMDGRVKPGHGEFMECCVLASSSYVFMLSKKSALFLAERSLSSRNSMASMVPIGARMRRRT
jgi:hypothetical protein